ncbi:MAG: hypothetical protein ACR2PL_10960 [Dehalococcoidia bacterium]
MDVDAQPVDGGILYVVDAVLNFQPGHRRLALAPDAPHIMLLPKVLAQHGLQPKNALDVLSSGSADALPPLVFDLHSVVIGRTRETGFEVEAFQWGRTHKIDGLLGRAWIARFREVELVRERLKLRIHLR